MAVSPLSSSEFWAVKPEFPIIVVNEHRSFIGKYGEMRLCHLL